MVRAMEGIVNGRYGAVGGQAQDIDDANVLGRQSNDITGAATQPPAESDLDVDVRRQLSRIVHGTTPVQIHTITQELIDTMVARSSIDGFLSLDVVTEIFNCLRQTLKQTKHEPLLVRDYVKMYKAQLALATSSDVESGERPGKDSGNDPTYFAISGDNEDDPEDPEEWGLYLRTANGKASQLTNFCLYLDRDVDLEDDLEPQRRFEGRIILARSVADFSIHAKDFASNEKLLARVFESAGAKAEIFCRPNVLRTAISAVSNPTRTRITTNLGWDRDAQTFLVPAGAVSFDGFKEATAGDATRVDLSGEERARHLNLKPLTPQELVNVKRHIVDDLLQVHNHFVTHTLLAMVALAVLFRFTSGVGKFTLWLTGLTGCGKTFLARLFQSFFGSFPTEEGLSNWGSSPNYIERTGYYFNNALYVVDDFKSGVARHEHVVRVLQAYADNTSRGRLRSDATTNKSRWIRGLLVSTGEDVPEKAASAIARSIIVPVPQITKDVERGHRCLRESGKYSGFTLDFIRWCLATNQASRFADRVQGFQERYYRDIAGQQNDLRIASNFALLAAAFEVVALYLADIWPHWQQAIDRFVGEDLVHLRNEMLVTVCEEQESEVFLRILGDLIQLGRVRINDLRLAGRIFPSLSAPLIGRFRYPSLRHSAGAGSHEGYLEISAHSALEEVNTSLQNQGRTPLRITERTLIRQLREDGRLVQANGRPVPRECAGRRQPRRVARIQSDGPTINVIRIPRALLISPDGCGDEDTESDGTSVARAADAQLEAQQLQQSSP